MSMRVLVTDGNHRPALAIVRALGRQGLSVLVGDEQPVSLASSSKYCAGHVTYPSPYRDRAAFEQFLMGFLVREKVDVLLPVTDVTTRAICTLQDAIRPHAAIAVPSIDAFEFVSNKARLLECAARYGLPIPRTHFVEGLAGLRQVVDQVRYPAVVKPIRSRVLTEAGWVPANVDYAYSEKALWQLYRNTHHLTFHPSLIQERIDGPGVGMFALFDRGRILAEFAHRRIREKPPAGGTSVLRESAPIDPRLKERARRMLGSIGWHGVAMMEYKEDRRTGELYLMEVNGRFWGSLQLAVDAGVNFPRLVCELALGQRSEPPRPYKIGVKSRWLLGDLDHLLLRLFKRDRALNLPSSAPSRLQSVLDFLRFVEPDLHYEVASRDDPRPFLYELRQHGGTLAASAAQLVRTRVARSRRSHAVRPTPSGQEQ